MLRWLSSLVKKPNPPAPIPFELSTTPPPAPRGFDAEKAAALSTYATKTRSAYALTMHGYPQLAYEKLAQREPLTPELIAYARGPGSTTLKSLGQAMTILAEAAGDVEIPDGYGGVTTVEKQLEQFRDTFPEYDPSRAAAVAL